MRKTTRRKVRHHHAVKRRRKPHKKQHFFRGVDNSRDIDVILSRTKLVQDLLGVSKENLSALYEQATGFLQQNRIEEAIMAFSLLTKFNPYAADFWIGLGVAYLLHDDLKLAFDAFIMALTMDHARYDCYAYCIECCLQRKDFNQAEAILKQAINFAKRHPNLEESAIILEEAPRIAQEIDEQKPVVK